MNGRRVLRDDSIISKMSIEAGGAAAATNQNHHKFVDGNVSEDLTCGVCRHAVRRAVQAPCGCRFCDVCISDKSICPNCDEKFVEDEIAPDHHARRKISKARIYCPNEDRGCSETFALKELQRHLEFCEYLPLSCMHRSRGCATKLPRKDLQRHLRTECEHRSVECGFCKSAFPHREVDVHRRSCPKSQVTCPNGCGEEDVRRETLRTHLDERCSLQKRSCKFEMYGCNFKVGYRKKKLKSVRNCCLMKHKFYLTLFSYFRASRRNSKTTQRKESKPTST